MSRRKQAKPRALKRDDWDTESLEQEMGLLEDVHSDTSGTERSLGAGAGDESGVLPETEEGDLEHSEKYRCETCGLSLDSLRSFMDHRNFDCVAGMDVTALLVTPGHGDTGAPTVAMETENSLESDLNGTDPPSWRSDTPDDQSLSPSSCTTPTDPDVELSYTIGVTENTPYACQFCDKAFPRLSYLKRHEQSHSDQMPFKCDYCQRLFKHKRSRDRHVKLHTGDKKYRCPHCEAAFSRSDHLKIHMKTHDNAKPFQCTTCHRGYNTAAALTSHMQTHILGHGAESPQLEKTILCLFCPQSCAGLDALASHIDAMHPGEKPNKCPVCGDAFISLEMLYQHLKVHEEMVVCEPESPKKEASKLSCMYCTKDTFPSAEALQLHLQAMHGPLLNGDMSNLSGAAALSRDAMSNAIPFAHHHPHRHHHHPHQQQEQLSFSCEYCTMKFGSVQALQKHTLTVHSFSDVLGKGKEAVFCSQCTMGFACPSALSDHVKMVHGLTSRGATPDNGGISPKLSSPSLKETSNSKISPLLSAIVKTEPKVNGDSAPANQFTHPGTLLCNQCNAAFPDFESFRTHLKTHLDEVIQKFVCTECQGEFASEEQLDGHVVTHYLSTTTEYGCQCCLKLFSKPDELQKHLMDIHAHHLYRCSLCKEMFDSKVSIQVHFAVKHSNECKLFKCTACNSVFRSEMEFQLHVKVSHLRQAQPFRCLFCNLSFSTELELQCHLMSHKKQFVCSLCDEAFHVEFLLDKHMQTKHATEPNVSTASAETSSTSAPAVTSPSVVVAVTGTTVTPAISPVATGTTAKGKTKNTAASVGSGSSSTPKTKETKCDICDADLPSESALNTHRKQVHNIKMSGSQKASQQTLSLYCAYCNEACKSRTELENHMKVHTLSSGKHKCNICDEVCPTASVLAEHKLTHCKVIAGSLCVICKTNLKSEDQYYSHLQQHNAQGLPLPCVVCRQTLMSEIEVQLHAKFHLKNAEPMYPCCLCLKQFETNNLIVNSTATNGGQQATYVCKECYHQSTTAETELRCPECKVKFETYGDLEKHRLVHKKTYQCIKCQMSFGTENEIQLHVASHLLHEGTDHECRLCHKVFDSPAKLQCHLIEHTFEGCVSYTCYMCSAVFTTAGLIQHHMLEHGLNSRPYDCTHCHQKFFFRAELENHVFSHVGGVAAIVNTAASTPNGDLQCPECLRTFASVANLTNHRKIHQPKSASASSTSSSSTSYKCSVCPDNFENSVDLQQHYFKDHSGSDMGVGASSASGTNISPVKKPLRCTECDQEFPCLSNLQGHMRIHTHGARYACPECGKEFALSRNLHIHMRSHSGEKPYECPICKKRFARKENRKVHLKSHSGVKPFLCPQCGKTFSRKCHVREHMRVHGINTGASSAATAALSVTCELCPEVLPSAKLYRQHLSDVHRKDLEHVCKICDEPFVLLKALKRHLRKVHGLDDGDDPGGGADGDLSLSSPEHSSCGSGDPKDLETSECSSLLESESSRGGSPFVVDDNNPSAPQEVMACE